jgi:tetratricopeptide (TPR) repeat protein
LRLFRRRPDLRFVGRLQPEVPEEIVQAIALEGQHVAASSIVLRSTVVTRERSESKLRWTCRLLELELAERPGDLRYLIEYGGTLLALNDRRGHAVLADAAKQVASARNAVAAPSVKVQVLLEYLLTVPPAESQARLTREEAYELALRWFPSSPALLYKCAETAFGRGDFPMARQILERLLELGRTGAFDRSRRFDMGIVGDDALINLAACCERLGDRDKAEQYYRQLLSSRHFPTQAAAGLKRIRR